MGASHGSHHQVFYYADESMLVNAGKQYCGLVFLVSDLQYFYSFLI